MPRDEFSIFTKREALTRQEYRCASCGEVIKRLDQQGKISHKFGEGAHAHHMRPCQNGGTNAKSNCVIICESCHYSVHDGGNYRNKSEHLITTSNDYKYFGEKTP